MHLRKNAYALGVTEQAHVHFVKGDILEAEDLRCVVVRDEDTIHVAYACLETSIDLPLVQ